MISACYILLNAEKIIEESFNSIINYVDEVIVVLDSRTTDNTAGVLHDYCALHNVQLRLYEYTWLNDSFSDARNFAASKATGDWILIIDGDEILRDFEMPTDDCDFYMCQTEQLEEGRIVSRFLSPRLFKNGLGIKFQNMFHEEIALENLEGLKGGFCSIVITNKEKSLKEIKLKARKLLPLHFKQLEIEPHNPGVKGQIAFCYRTLGDWYNCLDFAFMSLTMDKDSFFNGTDRLIAPNKAQVSNLIAEAYLHLDKPDIAKRYLLLSLKFCPDQITANAMLYNLISDTELKTIHKNEILRVGDNSKVPYDILIENLNFIERK